MHLPIKVTSVAQTNFDIGFNETENNKVKFLFNQV